MKQTTKVAITGLLSAAASVLTALAAEFGNSAEEATTTTAEPASKRGRKAAAAAPAQEPAPAETAQPDPAEPEVTGKTYEELRALIKPLVEGGQGAEVKQVIQKYAASLKEIQPKDHAAFEKDIAALSY